jgi:ectoine hydroxylase-related dioxygenase (phytanoyl-CoA dioxygenase family)
MKIDKPKIIYSNKYNSYVKMSSDLQKYGWVNIKNGISKISIKNLEKEFNEISHRFCGYKLEAAIKKLNKRNKDKLHELCNLVQKSSSHIKLINNFETILKNITKKKNLIISLGQFILPGPPKDKRLVYNFHQESSYYKNYRKTIHFHFPIFNNANLKNGAMSALSKTHKLNRIKKNKIQKKVKGFTSITPKNINKLTKDFEHVVFDTKLGDLLIFDGNLIHKSNTNFSNNCRIVSVHRMAQI